MKKRSKFSLSNYKLASMKMGYVVPVNLLEVLPGDTIQQTTGVFMRLAPMLAPVMHPVHLTLHHFFVPTRILWEDFEDFITGGPDGMNDSVPPTVSINPAVGSLADYFGLPPGHTLEVSALPFRAYSMIWNEYYRDQDLQTELPISLESGPDTTISTVLQRPCWQKDYFTTARPWQQKGPAVTIPLVGGNGAPPTFDIYGVGPNPNNPNARHIKVESVDGWGTGSKISGRGIGTINATQTIPGHTMLGFDGVFEGTHRLTFTKEAQPLQGVVSASSGLVGIDVNNLREALSIQRFEEHRSLFGSRYEDYLRFLGVRPQDARLQMPEYLGGGSQTIQFSEVLQTGGDVVGQLFGHGLAAMRTRRIRRFVPEHGYFITTMMVRPIPVYAQGVDRMWLRKTKDMYWQKELEHIGQQEVMNAELYADGTAADQQTFGFQNRFDEYRRGVNGISGEFRTSQNYWHMARQFANRPVLNSSFVQSNPTDRIFQATEQTSDQLYCMIQNNIIARRLISKNGNPI